MASQGDGPGQQAVSSGLWGDSWPHLALQREAPPVAHVCLVPTREVGCRFSLSPTHRCSWGPKVFNWASGRQGEWPLVCVWCRVFVSWGCHGGQRGSRGPETSQGRAAGLPGPGSAPLCSRSIPGLQATKPREARREPREPSFLPRAAPLPWAPHPLGGRGSGASARPGVGCPAACPGPRAHVRFPGLSLTQPGVWVVSFSASPPGTPLPFPLFRNCDDSAPGQ